MDELLNIFAQIWDLLCEMSPYLLLGFLLAGLMHAFVPGSLYSRYLAKGDFRSVLYAALFGIPLPLCSCGVIPTAMSLRKEGSSKGAAVSFLIATPQTGVDSIIATFSLMGLPFAIVRPIAALFTAIFGGQMVNWATRKESESERKEGDGECHNGEHKECSCGEHEGCSCGEHGGCSCGEHEGCSCSSKHEGEGFITKLKEALEYAFLEMMEDIGKWLVVGLVVAGLITILIPDSFFAIFQGNTLLSMLLVLCIAIPMYICATGSIPIAVALMMKGLTPGSALVLLMAGPACNLASILVINKVLGRRTLLTYLFSIIAGSVIFGAFIDGFLPTEWFTPTMVPSADCCHENATSWWSIASAILLIILLLNALWNHYHGQTHCHCHDNDGDHCHCHEHEEHCHCHEHEEEHCHCHEHEELSFTIKGMNCNHCRTNAEKVLREIPGVKEVEVNLASGRAKLLGKATIDDARQALAALGFDVVTEE